MQFDRIKIDPSVCGGKATIRGIRITVDFVLKLLGDAYTADDIVREYPELEKEDVYQAAQYGAWLASERSSIGMRILADLHVAPSTVSFLARLGHDVIRVPDVLPANSPDPEIVAKAIEENRVVLTQDLDFTDIIALSGRDRPSLLCLRLRSSRIEQVNDMLARVLPWVETDLSRGAIVTVKVGAVRIRRLPVELD